ncbi:MAG: hypothetical protein FOGNACKC_00788 [Anaerolineae bacterium]|nr:hypothetical protein [Anaerolineae bacterium]
MRRRRLIIVLTLFLALLLLCRVREDARGVWTLTGPGASLTALRDTRLGPVLWLYLGGEYQGQWKAGQWQPARPTPYPTATPYPTSTPYPTPGRRMPLEGA